MLKSYLILAWRNLVKSKMFSAINILGLAIGISMCMMISLFVAHQFSFDSFHQQGARIYRVARGFDNGSSSNKAAYLSGPYAPALLNDFKGQIQRAVRVMPTNHLVTVGNQSFNEKKIFSVDTDFFQLFSFPLLQGDATSALKYPNSVVLTKTTAEKYFGTASNAMGKLISIDKQLQLKITGIAKDVPSNSHLDFDLVYPITNYEQKDFFNVWINNSLYTYVLLAPGVSQQQVESRMPQFMSKYLGADMKKYGFSFTLSLDPLSGIYFNNVTLDGAKHGDKKVVYIFLSIAVLILVIACINFTNLSTIRAVERSKEVGLRKVMGALRNHLTAQFIGESVLLTVIASVLAVALMLFFLPVFNSLLGYTLSIPWASPGVYLFFIALIIVVGLLAGSYPALFLAASSPIETLRGKLKLGKGGALFRQALVVFQFSISVVLIISTIVISSQMSFVQNKKLGYNNQQTVLISIDNDDIYNNRNLFKKTLAQQKEIASVSMMSGQPGGFFDTHTFEVEGQPTKWHANTEFTDFEYVKTLGLKVIAGRDFSPEYPTDSVKAVLINRTAAARLGWTPDQAIGKWIRNMIRDEHRRNIIGVVEDFNFLSLKENISPLIISPGDDNRVAAIKVETGNIPAALAVIRSAYNIAAPQYPLEYHFLDQQFEELYRTDIIQQKLLSIFSVLAIFIACLGLFGLISYASARRTREIGVRKVLGSSVADIILLLSKDMLKPVLVATIIAVCVGYYLMHRWLDNFAYRMPLRWWIFAVSAFITFAIALLTMSVKSIQAAMANPVKSLRNE